MNEDEYKHLAAQLRQPHGEQAIATGEWLNKGNILINMDTIDAVKVLQGKNILEIGMGNGFFVHELFNNNVGLHYTGCDFSEQMVEEAIRLNAGLVEQDKARFIFGNAGALPFPDHSFDIVYTVHTLYFWDDTTAVAGEIKRVLKPGGHLVLAIRPKRLMKNYPFTQYGFTMYDKADAVALMEQNGFRIIKVSENREPDFEINGEKIPVENIVLTAATPEA